MLLIMTKLQVLYSREILLEVIDNDKVTNSVLKVQSIRLEKELWFM